MSALPSCLDRLSPLLGPCTSPAGARPCPSTPTRDDLAAIVAEHQPAQNTNVDRLAAIDQSRLGDGHQQPQTQTGGSAT